MSRGRAAARTGSEGSGGLGRVLCVTSNFPRWPRDSTTPFVLHQAQDLGALGWEVDVLAPHAPGALTTETLEGVHVVRFRYLPEGAETVCYGGGALVNLRKRPIEHAKLPALVAAELWACLRLLRSGRYDLLYTHWALPQGFVGALAAARTGVPHVLTVHGEEFFALPGRLLDPFKRFALHRAEAVTANSSATERAAAALAPRVRDLRRIPIGVTTDSAPDPALVASLRDRHRKGNGPLLLSLGRLVDEKGVEDAIRATAVLASRRPDVSLIVAGAGQDRTAFEALSEDLGLGDRVSFVGFVPEADHPSYFAAADVFLAPSRRGPDGWVEGQGITPLESMSLGTPVVGTRLGGYADTILDDRTALAVPERSPEAIAGAVERLVDDPELAGRLVAEGRRLVRERFSRPASARAFSEVFEDVLSSGRMGP